MENINLKGRTIEPVYGRISEIVPTLLAKSEKCEGAILSEADIMLSGVRNFKNAPELVENAWNTSTLSATKGEEIKVILPYGTRDKRLTDTSRMALGWINSGEKLVNYGVNLDIKSSINLSSRWKKLKGEGVYTFQRKDLILNEDLTESQAMKHELLLTKLGHPDYVDSKFARSRDEVAEIIGKTFELGKQKYGRITMLGQYVPNVNKKGILGDWYVNKLSNGCGSGAGVFLDFFGRFAFSKSWDSNIKIKSVDVDKARIQFQTLEEMLKPNQINQINIALNERDELEKRLISLDQIYSVIGNYIAPKNEQNVRKALSDLIGQEVF